MNMVEIYEYVKKHGDTKVVVKTQYDSGSQYTIPREGLSKYIKDNFFIDDVFEVVEDVEDTSPFTVKRWLSGGEDYKTRTVNIYGKEFEISYDFSYAAIDEDGYCWVYEYYPVKGSREFLVNTGSSTYLGEVEYTGDWKQSLIDM